MSVLIKEMEMPKNCGSCPFMREASWRGKVYPYVCSVKALVIKPSEIIFRDGLCPLVEVPTTHGDLIDRTKLYNDTANWEAQALEQVNKYNPSDSRDEWRWWSAVLKERGAFKHDVADAPTVIEAEVEEGE